MRDESKQPGGYLVGNSHSKGGIKIKTPEGQIEAEGGEVIVNKRALSLEEEFVCTGTPKDITSKINEMEGGVSWSNTGSCRLVKKAADGKDVVMDLNKADEGIGVQYIKKGKLHIVTADNKDQAELIHDAIEDYREGFTSKKDLENTLQSYMGDEYLLDDPSNIETIGGTKHIHSKYYNGWIPLYNSEPINVDQKTAVAADGSEVEIDIKIDKVQEGIWNFNLKDSYGIQASGLIKENKTIPGELDYIIEDTHGTFSLDDKDKVMGIYGILESKFKNYLDKTTKAKFGSTIPTGRIAGSDSTVSETKDKLVELNREWENIRTEYRFGGLSTAEYAKEKKELLTKFKPYINQAQMLGIYVSAGLLFVPTAERGTNVAPASISRTYEPEQAGSYRISSKDPNYPIWTGTVEEIRQYVEDSKDSIENYNPADPWNINLEKLGLTYVSIQSEDLGTAGSGSILRSTDATKRPSPSVSATIYPVGYRMEGNDGNTWEITEDSRGVHRWKKVKAEDGDTVPKPSPMNPVMANGGGTLTNEEISIIDNRISYYFDNNEYTKDSDVLTSFVIEGGEIDGSKYNDIKNYIETQGKKANGGGVDSLEKELHKLQRDLNSKRLQTYTEGDNSEEEQARKKEREVKLTRFNEVLRLLNEKKANGGGVEKTEKIQEVAKFINIGFDSSRGYKPAAWARAKRYMEKLVDLGYVDYNNLGRGKGKYWTNDKSNALGKDHTVISEKLAEILIDTGSLRAEDGTDIPAYMLDKKGYYKVAESVDTYTGANNPLYQTLAYFYEFPNIDKQVEFTVSYEYDRVEYPVNDGGTESRDEMIASNLDGGLKFFDDGTEVTVDKETQDRVEKEIKRIFDKYISGKNWEDKPGVIAIPKEEFRMVAKDGKTVKIGNNIHGKFIEAKKFNGDQYYTLGEYNEEKPLYNEKEISLFDQGYRMEPELELRAIRNTKEKLEGYLAEIKEKNPEAVLILSDNEYGGNWRIYIKNKAESGTIVSSCGCGHAADGKDINTASATRYKRFLLEEDVYEDWLETNEAFLQSKYDEYKLNIPEDEALSYESWARDLYENVYGIAAKGKSIEPDYAKLEQSNVWGLEADDIRKIEEEGEYDSPGHYKFNRVRKSEDSKEHEYEAVYDGLYMHVFANLKDLMARENEIAYFEYEDSDPEERFVDPDGKERETGPIEGTKTAAQGKKINPRMVYVTVSGGVADVETAPDDVDVFIVDKDNIDNGDPYKYNGTEYTRAEDALNAIKEDYKSGDRKYAIVSVSGGVAEYEIANVPVDIKDYDNEQAADGKQLNLNDKVKVSYYRWGEYERDEEIDLIDLPDNLLTPEQLLGFTIRPQDAGKFFYASDNDIEEDEDEEGTGVKHAYATDKPYPPQFKKGGKAAHGKKVKGELWFDDEGISVEPTGTAVHMIESKLARKMGAENMERVSEDEHTYTYVLHGDPGKIAEVTSILEEENGLDVDTWGSQKRVKIPKAVFEKEIYVRYPLLNPFAGGGKVGKVKPYPLMHIGKIEPKPETMFTRWHPPYAVYKQANEVWAKAKNDRKKREELLRKYVYDFMDYDDQKMSKSATPDSAWRTLAWHWQRDLATGLHNEHFGEVYKPTKTYGAGGGVPADSDAPVSSAYSPEAELKSTNAVIKDAISNKGAMRLFKKFEENNDHSSALLVIARTVGSEKDIEEAESILLEHHTKQEMSQDLLDKRTELNRKLWQFFKHHTEKVEGVKYSDEFAGGGMVKGGVADLSVKEKAKMYSWIDKALMDESLGSLKDLHERFSKKFEKTQEQTKDIIDNGWAVSRGAGKHAKAREGKDIPNPSLTREDLEWISRVETQDIDNDILWLFYESYNTEELAEADQRKLNGEGYGTGIHLRNGKYWLFFQTKYSLGDYEKVAAADGKKITASKVMYKLEDYTPTFEFEDYELNKERSADNQGYDISIEFNGISEEVMADFNKDPEGEKYGKHFKEWAEKNDLYYTNLLSTEDGITFVVTFYGNDDKYDDGGGVGSEIVLKAPISSLKPGGNPYRAVLEVKEVPLKSTIKVEWLSPRTKNWVHSAEWQIGTLLNEPGFYGSGDPGVVSDSIYINFGQGWGVSGMTAAVEEAKKHLGLSKAKAKSTTKIKWKKNGVIETAKYKGETITKFSDDDNLFMVGDENFTTVEGAMGHIDAGSPMGEKTVNLYRQGAMADGSMIEFVNLNKAISLLKNFDINDLDDLERRMYDDMSKHLSKEESLQILINNVEGDHSQLSPKLAEIAELQEGKAEDGIQTQTPGSVQSLIEVLTDIGIDLDGEEENIVAGLRFELEDFVSGGHDDFETVNNHLKEFEEDWMGDIQDAKAKSDIQTAFAIYRNEKKATDGTKVSEKDIEIAGTILKQLGGSNRLTAMTGAYHFYTIPNGVAFRLKNPPANYVKIEVTGQDLYNVEVGRIRGLRYTIVDKGEGLYADMLRPFIEKATGLYLSLGTMGKKADNGAELESIRVWLKTTTEPFDDWDWDGETLTVFLNGKAIEKYDRKTLEESGALDKKAEDGVMIDVPTEEKTKFIEYVYDFYDQEYSKGSVEKAIDKYLTTITKEQWGGGDSVDREKVFVFLRKYPTYDANVAADGKNLTYEELTKARLQLIREMINEAERMMDEDKFLNILVDYSVNEKSSESLQWWALDNLIDELRHSDKIQGFIKRAKDLGWADQYAKNGRTIGQQNAEMVGSQNKQIQHHAKELDGILKNRSDIPAWVLSKTTRAANDLSDVAHYLDEQDEKAADGKKVSASFRLTPYKEMGVENLITPIYEMSKTVEGVVKDAEEAAKELLTGNVNDVVQVMITKIGSTPLKSKNVAIVTAEGTRKAADGAETGGDYLTRAAESIKILEKYVISHGSVITIHGSNYGYFSHGQYNLRVVGNRGAIYNIIPFFPATRSNELKDATFFSLIRQKRATNFAITSDGESMIDIVADGANIQPQKEEGATPQHTGSGKDPGAKTTPMKIVTFTKKDRRAVKITVQVYPNMSIYNIDNPTGERFPYVVGQTLNMGHRTWACHNNWMVNDEDPCPEKKIFGIRVSDIPHDHPFRKLYPSKFR